MSHVENLLNEIKTIKQDSQRDFDSIKYSKIKKNLSVHKK